MTADCDALLTLRPAAIAAIKSYQESGRYWANTENKVPPESTLVPRLAQANGHVVYIGAGMEVMRALADFPDAKYFHLVGGGIEFFENVKGEISERLRHLSGQVHLDVIDRGYEQLLSEAEIEALKHKNVLDSKEQDLLPDGDSYCADHPYIIRVRWTPSGQPSREFFVHLHPFTYADPYIKRDEIWVTSFRSLLKTIPETEPLSGIMAIGAPAPTTSEIQLLVERLAIGGFVVTAQFGKESPDPRDFVYYLRYLTIPSIPFSETSTEKCITSVCGGKQSTEQYFVFEKLPPST